MSKNTPIKFKKTTSKSNPANSSDPTPPDVTNRPWWSAQNMPTAVVAVFEINPRAVPSKFPTRIGSCPLCLNNRKARARQTRTAPTPPHRPPSPPRTPCVPQKCRETPFRRSAATPTRSSIRRRVQSQKPLKTTASVWIRNANRAIATKPAFFL